MQKQQRNRKRTAAKTARSVEKNGNKQNWLVVSTHLKNISQIGKSSPSFGVKIPKNI